MRRTFLAIIILTLLPAWCLADAPLADRVPGDALIYVGWSGSESLGPAYPSSHLKAVLDASELPEFFQNLFPQIISKQLGRGPDDVAFWEFLSSAGGMLWRHPTAIYFGGINWDTGGPPMPRIAVLCDAGSDSEALTLALTNLTKYLHRNGPPISVKEYGTLVVAMIGSPEESDKQFANPPAASLAESPSFKTAFQQVQGDAVSVVFLDVSGLVQLVDDGVKRVGDLQAMAMWPKIRDGLGLTGIHQIIATAGFDGQDWMEEKFVSTGGPKSGLATFFDSPPLTDDALSVVPQSANRFAAGHLDLGGAFRGLHSAIEQFDPNVAQQFNQGLAIANAMLGMDIQNDLLDSLGDQWVIYTDRSIGGSGLLGVVVVNKLNNAEKAEAALTSLSQRANMLVAQAMGPKKDVTVEFRQSTIDGMSVHYLAVPLVAPGWGIKDGNLYLGLYPQVVSAAAAYVSSKGSSILQSELYLALQKRLGDHKPSSVSFLNLPDTASEGYDDLLAMSRLYLGFADIMGIRTPAMVIPPLGKITPHLAVSGGVGWTDEAGWHYKSVEPFPGSGALAGTGSGATIIGPAALMASILAPALSRSREQANRVKSMSNERQIGQAMIMYANENKQKYPPDLGTLVKAEEFIPASTFISPDSNTQVPPGLTRDQQADWVNVHSDYIYLGSGLGTNGPADQILLYEKPGAHGGQGMGLLYNDGHVEWQNTGEAMREIDAQQKKIHAGEGGGL